MWKNWLFDRKEFTGLIYQLLMSDNGFFETHETDELRAVRCKGRNKNNLLYFQLIWPTDPVIKY